MTQWERRCAPIAFVGRGVGDSWLRAGLGERMRSWLPVLTLVACSGGEDDSAPPVLSELCPAEPAVQSVDLSPRTNLLILSIDTLRRDAVGRYGGGTATPFLDGLASGSLVLDDHASGASWTLPSMMCALAGRCGEDMGVIPHPDGGLDAEDALPEGEPDLWTWLVAEGFATAVVTPSPMLLEVQGMSRDAAEVHYDRSAIAEVIAGTGLEVIERLDAGTARWAVQVHFIDPHSPYTPPQPYLTGLADLEPLEWDLDSGQSAWVDLAKAYPSLDAGYQALVREHVGVRYAGEVRYLDDQLALLWAALEDRGLLDDTVVLLFSDHGEQLWDHGLWHHNKSLHPEEREALALLWTPDVTPQAYPTPTHHRDLLPTVFGVLGVPVPSVVTGTPLGQAPPVTRSAIIRPDGYAPIQVVDYRCLTLHYRWAGFAELYRRDTDPLELEDLSGQEWPTVQAMMALLAEETELAGTLIDTHRPKSPSRYASEHGE